VVPMQAQICFRASHACHELGSLCSELRSELLSCKLRTAGNTRRVSQPTTLVVAWGPNSTCDVALPLELTSGLGRDRGESGGLRGVLVAPARRRVKLGRLFIGIVGSGCTRSRIMRLGLVRVRTVDIKGTGGITG